MKYYRKRFETIGRWLSPLILLRVGIFAITFLHVVFVYRGVLRWYEQFGGSPGDTYPDSSLRIPFVLLVAAALLLIQQSWAQVLALVISGWLIYALGFLGLYYTAQAHDLPFLSYDVMRRWFAQRYLGGPQEFLQLALALGILLCAAVTLLRVWHAHKIRQKLRPAAGAPDGGV